MAHDGCCGGTGACRTNEAGEARLHEGLIVRYLRGVENFDERLFDLTDEQTDTAFQADAGVGRWPVRVLLGHLADAELVYTHRIRRTIAEDAPVLSLWDENAFVDGGIYGPELRPPVAGFVAAIHTMRRWTAELLMSLTPEQWERKAMHPERGEMTVRQMVEGVAKHLEHHNDFLQKKVDLFLGAAETGGSCGSGCCCHGKG
ncbi:MAG: DinB family protein [Phycisphaerales bacterium]|nr:DinB family protein [Phycisphaerales bacterium]